DAVARSLSVVALYDAGDSAPSVSGRSAARIVSRNVRGAFQATIVRSPMESTAAAPSPGRFSRFSTRCASASRWMTFSVTGGSPVASVTIHFDPLQVTDGSNVY